MNELTQHHLIIIWTLVFNCICAPATLFGLVLLLYNHLCFRFIYPNGDIYEGGWNMGFLYGKGEYEYYEDGSKEIGQWVESGKQGEFECHDKSGKFTHRKIYKDGKVIKCEEVKSKFTVKSKER